MRARKLKKRTAPETPPRLRSYHNSMANLSIGIVGLPNVGKSTLFQALTAVAVPADNYPFCTIKSNIGVVEVPDPRLDRIHAMVDQDRERVPAVVEFVDIAGLVEGAAQGEGLGNRFLAQIRETSAVAHVVRAFEDESVVRTGGASTDPWHDREIVEMELALADLETVARRREAVEKKARAGDREAGELAALLERVENHLDRGEPMRTQPLTAGGTEMIAGLHLLTAKPTLYVLNVDESALTEEPTALRRFRERVSEADPGARCVTISAKLEAELALLPAGERAEYMEVLGLQESGLDRLIREGYDLLGLETFFTIGETEVHAWTVRAGALAPEAAGKVHSDFERGFIRAETIGFDEFRKVGSMKEARSRGLVRSEGKEYVVQDGDILFFRSAV